MAVHQYALDIPQVDVGNALSSYRAGVQDKRAAADSARNAAAQDYTMQRQQKLDAQSDDDRGREVIGTMAVAADTPEKWAQATAQAESMGVAGASQIPFERRGSIIAWSKGGRELQQQQFSNTMETAKFAETKRSNRANEANAAARAGQGGRGLNGGIIGRVTDAGSMLQSMAEFTDTFDPTYGGGAETMIGGDLGNTLQSYVPGIAKNITAVTGLNTSSPEAADWWRRYQDFKNEVRHGKFGGALTPTEKAQFDKQSIDPGMDPKRIQAALGQQARIVKSATARLRGMLVSSGYDQAAIDEGLGLQGEGAYVPGTGAGAKRPGLSGAPLPPDPKMLKMGTVYETNQGPARYIGNGEFEGME